MKKNIFLVLLLIFIINFFFHIYTYRNEYLTPYNAKYWEHRYLISQWVVPNSKNAIGDDGLYTYAGWEYIHGRDPTTLNAEIPPLGKYLIGLSEVVFNNQNIFSLLCGVFVLGAFFLLNRSIFTDKMTAFIPVLLFSFEPLFFTQLRAPFLDLLYLGLLLMTFAFFLRKQFILSGIFLGLMAATKATSATFPLVFVAMLCYLLLTKQKEHLKKFFLIVPVSSLIFILTYIEFFLKGNSLFKFLGVQKYIIAFYSNGAHSSPIAPFEIIFTGKWHTWWGAYIPVTEWHVGWIVLFVLSCFACVYLFMKRIYKPLFLSVIWFLLYLLFLAFIPVWPRYLLTILPFMYNLSIWVFLRNTHSS